ncbi:Mobile element protein [Pseudonocardia sp. Ae717_Ps2]|nr:IS256 family transposase [Pseudonocardia sp. Ae717_Ps2]OLM27912.1 Mobile element protein [Pseudonocardia sp. Ae717_Ps2]
MVTAAGAVAVRAPRVDDRRIDPRDGRAAPVLLGDPAVLVPQDAEDHRGAAAALPARPLVGDFVPALGQFLGSNAGLSSSTVTRLTETWKTEQQAFSHRDLSGVDYVYVWADGIHVTIRLAEHKLCLLVLIGVRADGHKELVALVDGYREATESWADLLRDCARRGMRAPVLAVGDGALGFWGALREVFPETREQRCWVHKTANVLAALPKSAHPGAKKALTEIWNVEDKHKALDAVTCFDAAYGAKFGKAVAKVRDDLDELLAFYDFPAEALAVPTHHEPDRVHVRDRPPPHPRHPRARLTHRRARDGVQTHRSRPGPLARRERPAPGRARPRRSSLRGRTTR